MIHDASKKPGGFAAPETSLMRIWMATAVVAASIAFTCQGASAKSWKFDLHNNSAVDVTAFKTQEGGEWSENWLEENVKPAEVYEMDFGSDEGDCSVRTRIEFSDATYLDSPIDYCKIKNIYARNKDVRWD
jgi:hypothetical protein